MTKIFSATDWDEDFRAIFARRVSPPPCPGCRRSGFYGPRKADNRVYEMCKFCGRYQAPEQNPVQLIATVHGCPEWPEIAEAPYIWWVQPHEQRYECPYCRSAVIVSNAKVNRPVDDPSHPWWAVPQGMTFEAARHYWVAHGQHRVYL